MTDFPTVSSVGQTDFGIVIAGGRPVNWLMHPGVALHGVGSTSGFTRGPMAVLTHRLLAVPPALPVKVTPHARKHSYTREILPSAARSIRICLD